MCTAFVHSRGGRALQRTLRPIGIATRHSPGLLGRAVGRACACGQTLPDSCGPASRSFWPRLRGALLRSSDSAQHRSGMHVVHACSLAQVCRHRLGQSPRRRMHRAPHAHGPRGRVRRMAAGVPRAPARGLRDRHVSSKGCTALSLKSMWTNVREQLCMCMDARTRGAHMHGPPVATVGAALARRAAGFGRRGPRGRRGACCIADVCSLKKDRGAWGLRPPAVRRPGGAPMGLGCTCPMPLCLT